jgi:MoaA/NifB/PqqE/SkfB family radical SAM enzyme
VTEQALFTVDPAYAMTPIPRVLWIELTSKCPFDCIFCTRKTRFGAGRHLDFDVFQRLIAELDAPDFIGLNYSGESIHYPRLLEAIHLAKSTGALTEVVTAFSTISTSLLRGVIQSGLDRLAVSLHTMDGEQYRRIYQLSSLELLKRRIADFLEIKRELGRDIPRLDFCFVAMQENLDQLPRVVEYAKSVGAAELSVHPIIGRHLVPYDFSQELAANRLTPEFKQDVRSIVRSVEQMHPGFHVNVLNPDIDLNPRLSQTPDYYAPGLPPGARIHTCDQTPFESVHILANGDVVVCEVHDEVPLGNLHEQTLAEIWHGERYQDFRRRYVEAKVAECGSCVWKKAYIPAPWVSAISVREGMSPQFLRGWHAYESSGAIWSKKQALLALSNPRSYKRVRIVGTLPPGLPGGRNALNIVCNHAQVGRIENQSNGPLSFDTVVRLPSAPPAVYLELNVERLFRPSLRGESVDSRDLGFALQTAEMIR